MALDINVKVTLEGSELATAITKLADALSTLICAYPVTGAPVFGAPQESVTFKPEDVQHVGPVNTTPAAVQAPESAPAMPQPTPAVPVQATAPAAPVAPVAPVAPAPAVSVTKEQLQTRCVALVQNKKIEMPQLSALLAKYGAPGIPQLTDTAVASFWADLDAMGV